VLVSLDGDTCSNGNGHVSTTGVTYLLMASVFVTAGIHLVGADKPASTAADILATLDQQTASLEQAAAAQRAKKP
jgi:hypothetical protein